MFDFSNYSADSKNYNGSDKLVVGKMKDETHGVTIKELDALKSKMYSFLTDDSSEHEKKRVLIKMLLQLQVIMSTEMFCWIRNVWDIRWIGFEVKIIE